MRLPLLLPICPPRPARLGHQIDVAVGRRRAVRIHHAPGHARGAHQLHADVDVQHFLAHADGDRPRVVDRRRARVIRRRVVDRLRIVVRAAEDHAGVAGGNRGPHRRHLGRRAASRTSTAAEWPARHRPGATTTRVGQARQRVDVVVAGHQAPHAILAAVVRLPGTRRRQPAIALHVLVAHDANRRAGHRFAILVQDAARDDAAARQPELDAFHLLAVAELKRRPRLERPALSIGERDEAGFGYGERVAAGRQLGKVEQTGIVREHAASARQFRGGDEHPGALHRSPGIGGGHTAADAACRRRRGVLRLGRRVPRGALGTGLRLLRTRPRRLLAPRGRAFQARTRRKGHATPVKLAMRPTNANTPSHVITY